jgi:hypothetical protein
MQEIHRSGKLMAEGFSAQRNKLRRFFQKMVRTPAEFPRSRNGGGGFANSGCEHRQGFPRSRNGGGGFPVRQGS